MHLPSGELVEVGRPGAVDLAAGLRALSERGILHVLAEGGAGLAASLWRAGLVDRGVWYLAASVAGGIGRGIFDAAFATLSDARPITITEVTHLGPDLRLDWTRGA